MKSKWLKCPHCLTQIHIKDKDNYIATCPKCGYTFGWKVTFNARELESTQETLLMEKMDRSHQYTGGKWIEEILDKLDEIVEWINEQEAAKKPEREQDNGNT